MLFRIWLGRIQFPSRIGHINFYSFKYLFVFEYRVVSYHFAYFILLCFFFISIFYCFILFFFSFLVGIKTHLSPIKAHLRPFFLCYFKSIIMAYTSQHMSSMEKQTSRSMVGSIGFFFLTWDPPPHGPTATFSFFFFMHDNHAKWFTPSADLH